MSIRNKPAKFDLPHNTKRMFSLHRGCTTVRVLQHRETGELSLHLTVQSQVKQANPLNPAEIITGYNRPQIYHGQIPAQLPGQNIQSASTLIERLHACAAAKAITDNLSAAKAQAEHLTTIL